MVQHAGPAFGIGYGGHLARGLVIDHIPLFRFRADQLPVHAHLVAFLHLGAHFRDGYSVHRHLTPGDHFLRPAAAGHAAFRHVFL